MHSNTDVFCKVIKAARKRSDLTVEKLADEVGVSSRSIYSFEDGSIKPQYDVLYNLIRVLGIDANSIFYPEASSEQAEVENLVRMLYQCDERSLEVVKATVKALIETVPEKETVHK